MVQRSQAGLWFVVMQIILAVVVCRRLLYLRDKDSYHRIGSTKVNLKAHIAPVSKYPDIKLSCNNALSRSELSQVQELESMLKKNSIKDPIVLLTTMATLDAVRLQLESVQNNAPGVHSRLVIFCVGQDTCNECKSLHDKCLEDETLNETIKGAKGADSMGKGGQGDVDKTYVDIIWRKPELMQMAFLAAAESVLVVDTDGVWFSEPPEFVESVIVSSEYLEKENYLVTKTKCDAAPIYRGAPLVLNSGTVFIRNDEQGRAVLTSWLFSRANNPLGACNLTKDRIPREQIMLDQDGLNIVACDESHMAFGKIKGLSSNDVLLNSVHIFARETKWFDLCKSWFFHSTNCGTTSVKATCMTKNLERRKNQCSKN